MADTDTYPGVDQDEEQKRKDEQYPAPNLMPQSVSPVSIQSAEIQHAPVMGEAPSAPAAPAVMEREPGGLVKRGAAAAQAPAGAPAPAVPPKPVGPAPTWGSYAPPAPTGLGKVGHALASFMPAANEYFNIRPQVQAQQAYGAATKEHENEVAENQKAQELASKTALEASEAKEHEASAATKGKTVTVQGPNGPVEIPTAEWEKLEQEKLKQTGAGERTGETVQGREKVAEIGAGKAKYADLEIDGKKVPGKVDAQGNLQLADGTPAPKGATEYKAPTYAEVMGGRLTNILIDGVPTQVQLQPQGGIKVIGESGAGALAGRVGQAKIVESAGDQLIKDIEANKDKLGNMQAMVSAALLGTPWSDPETQQLYSEIGSYIALHPAMHGFRGTNALDHFSRLIGGIPNNPDAMIAGIKGLSKMANIFTEPTASGGAAATTPTTGKHTVGEAVTIKGKPMKITKVHPDGSFDAE